MSKKPLPTVQIEKFPIPVSDSVARYRQFEAMSQEGDEEAKVELVVAALDSQADHIAKRAADSLEEVRSKVEILLARKIDLGDHMSTAPGDAINFALLVSIADDLARLSADPAKKAA